MKREPPAVDYAMSPKRRRRTKRGPLTAFCILLGLLSVIPLFLSEANWARGVGDIVLIAFGLIVVTLIVWDQV